MGLNKLINNRWSKDILGSLIASLIGLIGEGLIKIPWLSTFLSNKLNIELYWIVIIIILTGITTRLLTWLINRNPQFTNYTQDSIWNYVINWCWQKNKETKLFQIKNVLIVCPKCNNGVVKSELYGNPYCSACSEQFYKIPSIDDIENHIILNISRKFSNEKNLVEEPEK